MWKPTLGGWLTIFNGVSLLTLILLPFGFRGQLESVWEMIYFSIIFALLLPLGWWFALPGGSNSVPDVIGAAFMVGVNCVIWGYGLEYLLKRSFKRREPRASGSSVTQ
jgi:hypothetical protein